MQGPFYCDNRILLSHPKERTEILNLLVSKIVETFPANEAVIGVATGGIPMGAWVSHLLNQPFGYVRSEEKKHGSKNALEGGDFSNKSTILIEDLVNQGSSLKKVLTKLRENNVTVSGCFCLVSYETQNASKISSEFDVPIFSLTTCLNVIHYAESIGRITQDQVESFAKWHENPKAWSESYSS